MARKKHPNRIKELRLSMDLTQYELGQKFTKAKDPTIISRWERGVVRPSSDNLLELARILKVDPSQILSPSNETDMSVYKSVVTVISQTQTG